MLLPEFREQYRSDTVKGENPADIADTALITGISEGSRYRACKCQHHGKKSRTDPEDSCQSIGIHCFRISPFLVCKSETACLQPKHEDNLKYGYIGHELRHDPIAFRCQHPGIDRDEQEIDDTGQNSAQTLYCGLPCKLFQRISHNGGKITKNPENT